MGWITARAVRALSWSWKKDHRQS